MINFFNVSFVYKSFKIMPLFTLFKHTNVLVLAKLIVNPQRVEYKCILFNCACKLCLSVVNRARSSANNSKHMYSLFMSFSVIVFKSIESLISFTNN